VGPVGDVDGQLIQIPAVVSQALLAQYGVEFVERGDHAISFYRAHKAGRASNPRACSHQAATRSNFASSSMRPTS